VTKTRRQAQTQSNYRTRRDTRHPSSLEYRNTQYHIKRQSIEIESKTQAIPDRKKTTTYCVHNPKKRPKRQINNTEYSRMGKFLKDSKGNLVAIEGGLVLERTLDRKPRDCESCGFSKWVKKDKVFIIQGGSGTSTPSATTTSAATATTSATPDNLLNTSNASSSNEVLGGYAGGGSMEWICPECAIKRGLPIECYHKNFYAPGNAEARHKKAQQQQQEAANNNNNNDKNGGTSSGLNKLLDMTSSLCRF
jgi:hypothetical protein